MRQQDYASLGDVVRDGARACGDKPAVIFEDEPALTYGELDRRSNRAANMLREIGVEKGDRVAILGKNSLAYVAVMFGVAKLGAALTPINWRLAPPEVGYVMRDSGACVVIVDAALTSLLEGQTPPGVTTVVIGEPGEDGYDRRMARTSDVDLEVPLSRGDLAMLLYTSGTTGHPKGAMLSHGTFARHCGLDAPGLGGGQQIRPDDVALLVLPLFHIGSIEPTLRLLFSRATVVIHREFDPVRYLMDMQRRRATILALVPTALQAVLGHPDAREADFSTVRRFYYGASPIPLGLLQEAIARVDCEFVQAYGMTESCATIVMLAPEDHLDPKSPRLRSAGRPCTGAELKILRLDGSTAAPHEVGEIALRGEPWLMTGYWNRPEASAEALTADGWLKTGDAGYLDEDGYVYIHDRVKDMICSGGENIYPAEVESAVWGHPDVAEVAVIGVPDAQWGEAVKAVVVAKPGHEIDPAELIAWTRTRIAAYKTPKSVDVIAELPKNGAGKILRRSLRDPYWAGRERLVN